MHPSRLTTQRLAALFLLGCLLFNYPLLALFNKAVIVCGVPLPIAYLFLAWLGFLGLVAWVSERSAEP